MEEIIHNKKYTVREREREREGAEQKPYFNFIFRDG